MSAYSPSLLSDHPRHERDKSVRWSLVGMVTFFFVGAALAAQAVLAGVTEGYCLAWPSIGTHYAAGYSARGFERIEFGMTKAQVTQLIGRPLAQGFHVAPAPSGHSQWQRGDETWSYSKDSSALGGDWAWLSREVVFRDGIVVQTVRRIYYD